MKKREIKEIRKEIRCAIYTRKSTEEGLDQEFNSLDAQREAAEAFIKSQRHEGWVILPERYDDGGFTGGNMDRPALKRLVSEVEAGSVDAIVVYKVDRLSRSLLDFSRIMEALDRKGCSFVSVTQQFNTTHSMGRLTLNILLSFAQFEREIIAERTRDKMSAARKKGKWIGGFPILGYDIDYAARRMVINEPEAAIVKEIFQIYLKHRSLLQTVDQIDANGWQRKSFLTKNNKKQGGSPWNKLNLYNLLTNITYTGRVLYDGEIYKGEHDAIIDISTWEEVQSILKENGKGSSVRVTSDAILRGVLYCGHCNVPMIHTHSAHRGSRRYRYYTCMRSRNRGGKSCPSRPLPAGEIESFLLDRIRSLGSDDGLFDETMGKVREAILSEANDAQTKVSEIALQIRSTHQQIKKAFDNAEQLEGLSRALEGQERALREAKTALAKIDATPPQDEAVREALLSFAPLWNTMTSTEKARIFSLLIERATYNCDEKTLAITFHANGFKALSKPSAE